MSPTERAPDCFRCKSFHITYDPARPYGCRAFGFKSLRLPMDEVRMSSGRECHLYESKPAPPRKPESRES